MAGGAITPSGSYNGRITRFVGVSSMVAALGGLIFGYDGGVSGGLTSMEPFLKKFFPGVYKNMKEDAKVKFNSQILTLFTSSLYLAGLFAFIRLDHHTSIWPQAVAPYWWCGDRRWVDHWQRRLQCLHAYIWSFATWSWGWIYESGDRYRRRSLYFLGGAVMFVPIMVIRGIMATKLSDEGTLSEGYSCIVLVLICTYLVGFTLSRGALTNLVPSEIFQLEIRSAGQGIMTATNVFITFCMGRCLLAMLCVFRANIFFFFGTWIAGMTIFVYLFLPETKNVPIEKME